MKIVDVNVLVYACNERSPQHETVLRWWESTLNGDEPIGFNWTIVVGFLRMMTNRVVFDSPVEADVAVELMNQWLSRRNVSLLNETKDHWRVLAGLIASADARGNLMPDAHLAALAITHGATFVSCDNDFARFPDLRWENPLGKS